MPFSIAFTTNLYFKRLTGVNSYGKPEYASDAILAKGRLERQDNVRTTISGEEKLIEYKIYSYHEFSTTDLIFLPGTDISDNTQGLNPLYVEKINAIGVGITTYEVAL